MKDDKGTMILEFVGMRAKMYSLRMAKHDDIMLGTEVEEMVVSFEEAKLAKGYTRNGTDIVKSVNYLINNEQNELQKNPMKITAFESSTTKGIKKNIAQAELRHEHFKNALLYDQPAPKVYIPSFKSINKRIYMVDQEKKTLDPFDDKRHILENGCDTLAHGHYKILKESVE